MSVGATPTSEDLDWEGLTRLIRMGLQWNTHPGLEFLVLESRLEFWESLERLLPVLGRPRSTFGRLGTSEVDFGRSLGLLGSTFKRLGDVLGRLGSTVGRLWSTFGTLWTALRRLLGCLGGSLGHLGRPWAALSEHCQKHLFMLPHVASIFATFLEGLEGLRTTCRDKVTKKTSSAGT